MLHVTEVRALAHMTECENGLVTCRADEMLQSSEQHQTSSAKVLKLAIVRPLL